MLHYEDGIVYGYQFPLRGMNGLKKDGSSSYSGSAKHTGYSKIQFFGITYKDIDLAFYENNFDENGNLSETVVTINGIPAMSLYEKCGYKYIGTVDLGYEHLKWFKLYELLL